MQKGAQLFFKQIFETPEAATKSGKRGRNSALHARRNECLIYRYFYYGQKGIFYSAILEKLENEFFISRHTIPYIFYDHQELFAQLRKEQPTLELMKYKWPHLKW